MSEVIDTRSEAISFMFEIIDTRLEE
jgi:hypothetical protein